MGVERHGIGRLRRVERGASGEHAVRVERDFDHAVTANHRDQFHACHLIEFRPARAGLVVVGQRVAGVCGADHHIAAVERVAKIDAVVTGTEVDGVVAAGCCIDDIVAVAAKDRIAAGCARQHIVAGLTHQGVATAAGSRNGVIAATAGNDQAVVRADDAVGTGRAEDAFNAGHAANKGNSRRRGQDEAVGAGSTADDRYDIGLRRL